MFSLSLLVPAEGKWHLALLLIACLCAVVFVLSFVPLSRRDGPKELERTPSYDEFLVEQFGKTKVAGVYPGVAAAQRQDVNRSNALYVRGQFQAATRSLRAAAAKGAFADSEPQELAWANVRSGLSSERGVARAYAAADRASAAVAEANELKADSLTLRRRLRLLRLARLSRKADRALTRFLEERWGG